MTQKPSTTLFQRLRHRLWVAIGSSALTMLFFLVLPLMQAINQPPTTDLTVLSVDTANIPPPPPPPDEPEPEKEKETEQKPPELTDEAPPLDLEQIAMALNPGGEGDGWGGGNFKNTLNTMVAAGGEVDDVFNLADLDQPPRVVYQPGPTLSKEVRKKAPGKVYVLFVVNQRGAVENPVVQKADDLIFEKPAMSAVKQWKFEPGKRNGQPVRFRMRVPITFPKG